MDKSTVIEITGLWKGTDKNGDPYMTGYMGNSRVVILKNKFKTGTKHPDYVLYIAEGNKQKEKGKNDDNITDI